MGGNLNELEVDAQINQATLLNTELLNKQMQQVLKYGKEKLLYTRNRMLQLSYEENMFKKKYYIVYLQYYYYLLLLVLLEC